jgi:hypothetical protein
MLNTEYKTIKSYVLALTLAVVDTDENGRPVGLSYAEIRDLLRAAFPVVPFPGPHMGRATRTSIKHIREMV